MATDLPFIWKHKFENEEYEKKLETVKSEKNMNEDEIWVIISDKLRAEATFKFQLAKERNPVSYNTSPFDMVIGNEDNLDMIGVEIKADGDNFSRLKTQLHSYLFCFDGVYLAVHKKNPPEWLPEFVGVLRVFEDKTIVMERHSYYRDMYEISTEYDWEALFKRNGLGKAQVGKVKKVLGLLHDIRRNILFNRFFAVSAGLNSFDFERYYPFTNEQKTLLIGFDVPSQYKLIEKDLKDLEGRFEMLKKIVSLGQQGLDEYIKNKKGKKNGS